MKNALLFGLPLLSVAVAVGYWWSLPRTPQALFTARCSSCHELPDLSNFRREELAPLVYFMRTHNGAARVISDAEAQIIITYLEETWPLGGAQ